MNIKAWHDEPVSKRHGWEAFDCGEMALNEFLQRHARKSHEVGGVAMLIDAKNPRVAAWYASYGALPLLDAPLSLLLPLATVQAALKTAHGWSTGSAVDHAMIRSSRTGIRAGKPVFKRGLQND